MRTLPITVKSSKRGRDESCMSMFDFYYGCTTFRILFPETSPLLYNTYASSSAFFMLHEDVVQVEHREDTPSITEQHYSRSVTKSRCVTSDWYSNQGFHQSSVHCCSVLQNPKHYSHSVHGEQMDCSFRTSPVSVRENKNYMALLRRQSGSNPTPQWIP